MLLVFAGAWSSRGAKFGHRGHKNRDLEQSWTSFFYETAPSAPKAPFRKQTKKKRRSWATSWRSWGGRTVSEFENIKLQAEPQACAVGALLGSSSSFHPNKQSPKREKTAPQMQPRWSQNQSKIHPKTDLRQKQQKTSPNPGQILTNRKYKMQESNFWKLIKMKQRTDKNRKIKKKCIPKPTTYFKTFNLTSHKFCFYALLSFVKSAFI